MAPEPEPRLHALVCDPWLGTQRRIPVSVHAPLLVALEAAGVDWPSACRSGQCRACMAQLHSGRVRYEMAWPGLSADEKAQGVVLPCAAYPQSDLSLSLGVPD